MLPVYGGGSREFSLVEWELAQAAHVQDSDALAGLIDQKLRGSADLQTVSVQKAGLRALAGANMPAVLIEMGYLSNPDEEKRLASTRFPNQHRAGADRGGDRVSRLSGASTRSGRTQQ